MIGKEFGGIFRRRQYEASNGNRPFVTELFQIPAREQIGRAKSVPADQYETVYAQLRADMERQIADIAAKGGDEE